MKKLDRFKVRELYLDSFASNVVDEICCDTDYRLINDYNNIFYSLRNSFDNIRRIKVRCKFFDD